MRQFNYEKTGKWFGRVSFGNAAIKALFGTSLLMLSATYISTASAMVIVGRIVGEVGLCAVNLVAPLYSYAAFFSGMIGIGSALLYFRNLGAYNKKHADEIFSQGVILAVSVGVVLLVVMILGEDAFLSSLQVSDAIRAEAEAFWKYEKFLIALAPIDFLLFEMLYTDTRITIMANITMFTVGIGASVFLTNLYGTMGASMGMFIGNLLCDFVLCLHFFEKKNIFSFRWHFSWKDIREMCRLSLVDSSTYLDTGLLILFINAYVTHHYSEELLPIAAVVIVILDIVVLFDSVGSAFAPVAEVYLGEGNYQDEKDIARFSLLMAIVFGVAVAALLYMLAPLIPGFLGLTNPDSIQQAVKAVRLFVPSMPFFSVAYMLISQYIAVRKIAVAVAFEWGKAFIFPLLCILVSGNIFGFNGIWGGFIPAEILAVGLFAAGIRLFAGKEKSIWLLEDNKRPTFSRSYMVSKETAVAVRNDIEAFLLGEKVSEKTIFKIMLTIEDMTMLLLEKNPGRKVIVQYTVMIEEDAVYVYERDNGAMYDLTDTDMDIKNFRQYVFNRMLTSCDYRQYLMTIDYNRNMFRYLYKYPQEEPER